MEQRRRTEQAAPEHNRKSLSALGAADARILGRGGGKWKRRGGRGGGIIQKIRVFFTFRYVSLSHRYCLQIIQYRKFVVESPKKYSCKDSFKKKKHFNEMEQYNATKVPIS